MLPELLEAYRRLQSGKRHARLDIDEMLELRVDVDPLMVDALELEGLESDIDELMKRAGDLRCRMDDLFRVVPWSRGEASPDLRAGNFLKIPQGPSGGAPRFRIGLSARLPFFI